MRPHPLEKALGTALKRLLIWAIPLSTFMLFIEAPSPDEGLLQYSMFHLLILQLAVLVLAAELAHLLAQPWFNNARRPWLASAVSLVALIVGFAALLTLATSAAARYDPSLQFLQLLSSLDIAWVTSAIFFGAWRMWGRATAWSLGLLIVLLCVASIAAYLNLVGFTSAGGWLVDSGRMMRIVLPADVLAAIAAVAVLLGAGFSQPTEQRSPQS